MSLPHKLSLSCWTLDRYCWSLGHWQHLHFGYIGWGLKLEINFTNGQHLIDHLHFCTSGQSSDNHLETSSSDHLHLALIWQSVGTSGATNSTLFLKLARLAQPMEQLRHDFWHNLGSALTLHEHLRTFCTPPTSPARQEFSDEHQHNQLQTNYNWHSQSGRLPLPPPSSRRPIPHRQRWDRWRWWGAVVSLRHQPTRRLTGLRSTDIFLTGDFDDYTQVWDSPSPVPIVYSYAILDY